jgi:hypothetical protein
MKNKAYFVNSLCKLKGLDPESEEAKGYYDLKVVDLLIEIKKNRPDATPAPEPEPQEEEDEFPSLAQRLGCS